MQISVEALVYERRQQGEDLRSEPPVQHERLQVLCPNARATWGQPFGRCKNELRMLSGCMLKDGASGGGPPRLYADGGKRLLSLSAVSALCV